MGNRQRGKIAGGEPLTQLASSPTSPTSPTFVDSALVATAIPALSTPIGVGADISNAKARKRTEQALAVQNKLLRMIALGRPLDDCLRALTQAMPRLQMGTRAFVMLADGSRTKVERVIATDSVSAFGAAIQDAAISEVLSFASGQSMYSGQVITSADVANDERWTPAWRDLCVAHGIRACHSEPVMGSDGGALASLMLCFDTPHEPSAWELRVARTGARLASIAIERARTEERFAAELADARLIQSISSRLIHEGDLDALYEQILTAAIEVMRSDMGTMQMFYPERNELRLLAQRGFEPAAASFWEWVHVGAPSSCGFALATGKRAMVEDVEACDFMVGTEDLDFYRLSGIGAVQSTPLIARDGRLVGMLSTHWRTTHQPDEHSLRLFDVLARQAADLIERMKAEEALRASERELQIANHRKDEFLGVASHELRTPLTSAKANVQIVGRRLARTLAAPAPDADALLAQLYPLQEVLARAEGSLDRLGRLVEDLLDISRIQAGKLEMRPRRMDLAAIVREAAGEESQGWPERDVRLAPPLNQDDANAQESSFMVEGDPDRLRQVVINYLANALKYAPSDRQIVVGLERRGDVARVDVRDEGPGLTLEQQERLFERFYRVDGIVHRQGSTVGLGLGLSICREIVERHGGQVGVDSVAGQGSSFWFTLPLLAAPSPGPSPAAAGEG